MPPETRLEKTGEFEYRVVLRPRPLRGWAQLRSTAVLHSAYDFRAVSLGQAYAIGASMISTGLCAVVGVPQQVTIGIAVVIVVGSVPFVGYRRPVTRWELEITPTAFVLVPVMVASDGKERADDRREPIVRGSLADLTLTRDGESLRIGSGPANATVPAQLSPTELGELQAAIDGLKVRYGDASMVPEALRRGVPAR